MNKTIVSLSAVGVVVLIIVGIFFIRQKESGEIPGAQNTTTVTESKSTGTFSGTVDSTVDTKTTETSQDTATYTLVDVAKHNNRASCWTVVSGNVYDVTNWISRHPGGSDAIVSLCGIDGSAAFRDQHGGQSRPTSELAAFKIGVLKK